MVKLKIIRQDGVAQRYPVKKKNISAYTPMGRGLYTRKQKPSYKPRYYRTLVSLSYYAKEPKKDYGGRICQYYVFVISDEKNRYSVSQMEKIEKNNVSLIMSMGAGRSDIRWRNSVYEMIEPASEISSLGAEDNVPIDFEETHGYRINHVYRTAIFFKHGGPVEYKEENIKKTERRLNDSGDLDTRLNNETGRLERVR